MQYTEEQKAAFKAQFVVRRRRQMIVAAIIIGLVLAAAFLRDETGDTIQGLPANIVVPVFAIVILGALVFSLKNWRCPACTSYLGKNVSPSFCPKCGIALSDGGD